METAPADSLSGVRGQRACAEALLGAKPRRLPPDAIGTTQRRAPRAGNARAPRPRRAARHAKRRWLASRRRQRERHRSARPYRYRALSRLQTRLVSPGVAGRARTAESEP